MSNSKMGVLFALVMGFGLAACNTEPGVDRPMTDEPAAATDAGDAPATAADSAEDTTLDLATIAAEPDKYIGQTVTVVADVEEVFGPNAFALDEDAFVRGGVDNDVLVVSKQAGSLGNIDDQWLNNKVRVTGTVARMNLVEVEREVGWDLNPEIEVELEKSGAVLIASSVTRTDD